MNHGLPQGRTTPISLPAPEPARVHKLIVAVPMSDVERFLARGYRAVRSDGHHVTIFRLFDSELSAMRVARALPFPCSVEEA